MTLNTAKTVWFVLLVLTLETLFCVPLLSWELALGTQVPVGVCFSLAMVGGITFVTSRWKETWQRILASLVARFESIPTGSWFLICFAAGSILRILWVWQYPAPQRSDQATYLALARGLVERHEYGFPHGGIAFWPPGYPFFLAAWFFVCGFRPWIPLLANLFLFAVTLITVDRLALRIGGTPAARFATLLLVPWPTMLMIAGFAGKELLVVPLLCLILLTFSRALESRSSSGGFAMTILSGLLLGAMSLTQPSFMLFVFVLIIYDCIRNRNLLGVGVRAIFVVAALCAVILPWTFRNHRVLGAWVPISTNGGDVFYRANNSLATGGFTPKAEQSLDDLDEVSRGKVGFRLGVKWIQTHPGKFLLLAVRKQYLFLGDDAQGAFETLKRGLGIGGLRYVLWKAVSNFYWWFIWMLILLMLLQKWRNPLLENALFIAVMLGVLYLVAMHSVFESGGKYHEPLMGLIAVIAGQVVSTTAAPRTNLKA
ncbi:MAG TPA: glycosyltransferase family 39 protein [Candidatus Acidoferrum sp.]|nr:glycosyltransferase family 39 protein [Candidatus Acidoferrum sp.]